MRHERGACYCSATPVAPVPRLRCPSLACGARPSPAVSVVTPAAPVPRLHPGGFPAATLVVSLSPAFPPPAIFINSLAKEIESACRFADDLTSAGITPSLTPGGCVFTTRDEPYVLRRARRFLSGWAPDHGGACGLSESRAQLLLIQVQRGRSPKSFSCLSPSLPQHRSIRLYRHLLSTSEKPMGNPEHLYRLWENGP